MMSDSPKGTPTGAAPSEAAGIGSVGIVAHKSLDEILMSIETREIVAALQQVHGQRTQAAKLLGISRSRLYRRMEALSTDPRTVNQQVDV